LNSPNLAWDLRDGGCAGQTLIIDYQPSLWASDFALRASGFALRATTRQDDGTSRPDKKDV